MTQIKRIFSGILGFLKRFVSFSRRQPFGVLAALCGIAAAALAVFLPWELPKILNDLNLSVAKQLAGTGAADLAPIRTAALSLLVKTACVAALYLASIWCALRCARKLRGDLRTAVNTRRAFHEAAGHTPPPDWEKEVGRDIDHISAMVAAAPEWLMVLAGAVFCVMLLVRTPDISAIWIPITAVAVCAARDILRRQHVPYAVQAAVMAALWIAGTLMTVLRAIQPTASGTPLGMLGLLLLGMTLIVPAALQAPYRNLRPAWEAFRRVHGFLK